jgi:hypothetical protein
MFMCCVNQGSVINLDLNWTSYTGGQQKSFDNAPCTCQNRHS